MPYQGTRLMTLADYDKQSKRKEESSALSGTRTRDLKINGIQCSVIQPLSSHLNFLMCMTKGDFGLRCKAARTQESG